MSKVERDILHDVAAQKLAGEIMKQNGTADPAVFLSAMCGCMGWVIAHLAENTPSKVKALAEESAEAVRKNAIDKMMADDARRREEQKGKKE